MESLSGQNRANFTRLLLRLVDAVNVRINNGEFSERGLARILGISQPQTHNILKGARKLSPETADLIFAKLDMSVLDLLTAREVSEVVRRKPAGSASEFSWFEKERAS